MTVPGSAHSSPGNIQALALGDRSVAFILLLYFLAYEYKLENILYVLIYLINPKLRLFSCDGEWGPEEIFKSCRGSDHV